ncbi:helix-turn-helix transcriptional regulator [Nocardia thailandica]
MSEIAAVPSGSTRRAELGGFLKSRRARIAPGDVGLVSGPRRRTPGLRREEVAQLSGVGVTWYTWLEQGRPINASVQVLDAIARTLRLDAVEKAHLYRLADVPVVPSPHAQVGLPPALQGILDQLCPLPAALLSARYDILAYNDAYRALCPGFLDGQRNVLRRVFLTPACCNPYDHDVEDLRRMVAYLRGAYVKHLDDSAWTALIDELHTHSPEFRELWARNDVAVPANRTKMIRHLAVGALDFHVTSMSLPVIEGAWVQVFTPRCDAEWTKLHTLLAMDENERLGPLLDHRERFHSAS